jgi:hypothetical protein
MTTTTPPTSSSPTAPTDPVPPMFHPAPGTPAGAAPPAASTPPTAPERTPWYRRVWVLAGAAVLLALLSFAGGFVAGNAAALFNGMLGVSNSGPVGPGWMDDEGFGPGGGGPGFGDHGGMPGRGDLDGDSDTSTN